MKQISKIVSALFVVLSAFLSTLCVCAESNNPLTNDSSIVPVVLVVAGVCVVGFILVIVFTGKGKKSGSGKNADKSDVNSNSTNSNNSDYDEWLNPTDNISESDDEDNINGEDL